MSGSPPAPNTSRSGEPEAPLEEVGLDVAELIGIAPPAGLTDADADAADLLPPASPRSPALTLDESDAPPPPSSSAAPAAVDEAEVLERQDAANIADGTLSAAPHGLATSQSAHAALPTFEEHGAAGDGSSHVDTLGSTRAVAAPAGLQETAQIVSGPAAPFGGQHQAALAPQPHALGAASQVHAGTVESDGADSDEGRGSHDAGLQDEAPPPESGNAPPGQSWNRGEEHISYGHANYGNERGNLLTDNGSDVGNGMGGNSGANQSNASMPLDSVTLGQLRSLVHFSQNRPRAVQYDFPAHADADALPREIDEFFSYVEAPQAAENRAAWEEWIAERGAAGAPTQQPDARAPESSLAKGKEAEARTEAQGAGTGDRGHEGTVMGARTNAKEWTSLPTSTRRRTIETLLSLLEVKDPMGRQRASRALLYLLQGAFADTHGEDHQLQWMSENSRMVRAAGGLGEIYAALKLASWKHDWLSGLPDHIASSDPTESEGQQPAPLLTPRAKADYLDEINLELTLHFAQLYILVEMHRGDEEWGDELMSLEPPLPIYLFGLVSSLREKPAKGYPVKKLLLLLWKTMLCCLGGCSVASRCRRLARDLEGLPPEEETKPVKTKATPNDMQTFQEEISVKFPTFQPPSKQLDDLPLGKIASAASPIPPKRPTWHGNDGAGDRGPNGGAGGALPSTPAPTPPPSPKPNKQKYQTDQSRPFVFPYSRAVQGARMVPYSIEEAARLYREHMHVSLEMWQLWRVREDYLREESGVGSDVDGTSIGPGLPRAGAAGTRNPMRQSSADSAQGPSAALGGSATPGSASSGPPLKPLSRLDDGAASSSGSRSPTATDGLSSLTSVDALHGARRSGPRSLRIRGEPTLERLQELEAELEAELSRVESDHMLAVLDNERYTSTLARLTQQRADARRLQRVDLIYRSVLPQLHSSVIVLLKLLLATVNQQNTTNSAYSHAIASGLSPEEAPPPTLEDIDIMRHREITSKAVSAILLLSLKWFKASHAMKFHYLSQLLVDSNSLLLILKMFGLQEVANSIKSRNEAPSFNFLRYCELHCGREPRQPQPEDAVLAPQPVRTAMSPLGGVASLGTRGDEVEKITDFAFRNFFSALNFTRILQKLTKRKVHRVLLLVQYKSSAILKRSLRVSHPELQLYVLKIIKSQVPLCGRKWRQGNMKVITAIYLNCRPDLRDEWLSGAEVDHLIEDSLPQEQALRALVKFYNHTRYGPGAGAEGVGATAHRRSTSAMSGAPGYGEGMMHAGGAGTGGGGAHDDHAGLSGVTQHMLSPGQSAASFFESDMLPPLRRHAESTPGTLRYIPDDMLDLDEYDDVLSEVFGTDVGAGPHGSTGNGEGADDSSSGWSSGKWGLTRDGAQTAWVRLGEILGESEAISDTESVQTIGELDTGEEGEGGGASRGGEEGAAEEGTFAVGGSAKAAGVAVDAEAEVGATGWESLSPEAMRFLRNRPRTPGSPGDTRRRRRSSSGDETDADALHAGADGGHGGGGVGGATANNKTGRSNSSSSPLRPVLSFGPEALADDDDIEESELDETPQPLPVAKSQAVDEVEAVFGD